MGRVVVIGGSGHVGTYLVPRLVAGGHEVVNVSRGARKPYQGNAAWSQVESVTADRAVEEAAGTFGGRIAALEPDIVVDMISFTLPSTQHLAEALRGKVQHFLHCGTIWVHGPQASVPTTEDAPRNAYGEYGTHKAEIEAYLLREAALSGFPATVFRPGHIVGPGWAPLNPAGHFSMQPWWTIAAGQILALPNFGMETVHHVHADDVAQMVMRAIASRGQALGEAFNTVSPAALNLRGYAEAVFEWFGYRAKFHFLPWGEWERTVPTEDAQVTWEHIYRSPNHSIEKARRLLGYAPRYTSLEAVREALEWMIARGQVERGGFGRG